MKAQAQDMRSAERVRRQTGGFPYDGHTYRSDREESIPLMVSAAIHAQVAIAMGEEAVALYNAALGNGWRDETGVARLTTAQEILALHGAFVAWGAANDRVSQMIAADIDAAETVEALEAIIAAIPTDARWPK
jgi:agmatine/peptidylarginine deiminase